MTAQTNTLRTCENGHQYYKSSDCPVCPACEKERESPDNFLSSLAAPARRALENKGITTVEQLSDYTQNEILQLHGMGKNSLPKLYKALEAQKLTFRTNK
jgi:predicted RecB family nuclease